MMESLTSKQAMRRARTRQAISDAAHRLFANRPVDAVAIDEIVAAASVAKGSFYNYYPDKDALVREIVGEIRANLEARVAKINADETDAPRRVARAICVFMRYAMDEPERATLLARVQQNYLSRSMPYNEAVVSDVEAGVAQSRFTVQNVEAATILILAVAQVGMVRIAQEPVRTLALELATQLSALLIRGLGVADVEANAIADEAALSIVGKVASLP